MTTNSTTTSSSCHHSTTPNTITYRDTSTECSICLCPYEEDPTTTTATNDSVIELSSCGHKYHLECIREQLARAQPTSQSPQRLVFRACRCAKCGVVCDHAALRDVLRTTDALLPKVDRILAEHLRQQQTKLILGARDNNSSNNNTSNTTENSTSSSSSTVLVERALHNYAFYLCSACSEPFLGGTVRKEEQDEEGECISRERLCPACRGEKRVPLNKDDESCIVWKCRYCCAPATRVCNNDSSIHMCEACHQRSIHFNDQEKADHHALEGILCPGGTKCPYPKPKENNFHSSGPFATCEQVLYFCSFDSVTKESTLDKHQGREGSENLLINPSGKEQFKGWRRLNINDSWQVESSTVPLNKNVATNFVSTHFWCSMEQTVDLTQATNNPAMSRIEVSARFMGHADCPSVFRLSAELLDAAGQVQRKKTTRILSAPTKFWERAALVLEPTTKAHSVKITLHGKDGLLMRGHYGSKVTDCAVRILGDHLAQ
mmetsp:Transcript_11757/g.22516  ORF Transcript_11757/g.22516 Transcript_11757/m.22516 type:complete len:490 (+) Transcript_11757:34-1503(+)